MISRLNTRADYRRRKCHQFHGEEKWRTLRKTGCYWAEEYATSQLHKRKLHYITLHFLTWPK